MFDFTDTAILSSKQVESAVYFQGNKLCSPLIGTWQYYDKCSCMWLKILHACTVHP